MTEKIKAFYIRVRWNEPRGGLQTTIYACVAESSQAAVEAVIVVRTDADEVAFTDGRLSAETIHDLNTVAGEVRALLRAADGNGAA